MKKIAAISLLICLSVFAREMSSFTDSRDNKTYKTVKIGNQTWMAENLSYALNGSKCGNAYGFLKDENTETCNKYGRLYNWEAALKACPSGWHIPKDSEWETLVKAAGGSSVAGDKLKAASGWNGTDDFGFSALPGGSGEYNGDFSYDGLIGNWWSGSESNANYAYSRRMLHDYKNVYWYLNLKSFLFSVRCVEN